MHRVDRCRFPHSCRLRSGPPSLCNWVEAARTIEGAIIYFQTVVDVELEFAALPAGCLNRTNLWPGGTASAVPVPNSVGL